MNNNVINPMHKFSQRQPLKEVDMHTHSVAKYKWISIIIQ